MNIAGEIAEKAGGLFDVFGVRRYPEGGFLLILGLESTPERNLDDFGHSGGQFHLYGYKKYVAPRLKELLGFIRKKGFTAAPAGRYGYPLEGEIPLKSEAISAGLGKRGRSTVVLHPEYGNRLRFMAVLTDAPMEPLVGENHADEEAPVCRNCTICIDACPVNILEPCRMTDSSICLSNVNPVDERGHSILCDLCLKLCPESKRKQV